MAHALLAVVTSARFLLSSLFHVSLYFLPHPFFPTFLFSLLNYSHFCTLFIWARKASWWRCERNVLCQQTVYMDAGAHTHTQTNPQTHMPGKLHWCVIQGWSSSSSHWTTARVWSVWVSPQLASSKYMPADSFHKKEATLSLKEKYPVRKFPSLQL